MADLRDVEELVDGLLFGQLVPWVRLRTALPPGAFGEYGLPPGRAPTDFQMLGSSVVVENFLREIVAWGRILAGIRTDLESHIDGIQRGIQESLGVP